MELPIITISILLFFFVNVLAIHVFLEEQVNYTEPEKNILKIAVGFISLITPFNLYLSLFIFFLIFTEVLEANGTVIDINKILFKIKKRQLFKKI